MGWGLGRRGVFFFLTYWILRQFRGYHNTTQNVMAKATAFSSVWWQQRRVICCKSFSLGVRACVRACVCVFYAYYELFIVDSFENSLLLSLTRVGGDGVKLESERLPGTDAATVTKGISRGQQKASNGVSGWHARRVPADWLKATYMLRILLGFHSREWTR